MGKKKIIEERIIPVQGTTKLHLYDPGYDQKGTNYEFKGNISSAPYGLLRLRKVEVTHTDSKFAYEQFDVDIFQAKNEQVLYVYADGEFYPDKIKKSYWLNCETAQFEMETKFGSHRFLTGGDGDYALLHHMKQYYGMILHMWFNTDENTLDDLEKILLELFMKRTVN